LRAVERNKFFRHVWEGLYAGHDFLAGRLTADRFRPARLRCHARGLRVRCGLAHGVPGCRSRGRCARERVGREPDRRLRHAVLRGQLLDELGLNCNLLQPGEGVGALLGCDLLKRLRALPVLVHVRGGLAPDVNRELRRESPLATGRAAQSLHHRLAGREASAEESRSAQSRRGSPRP
jgi:hypothetical protein